MLIILLHFIGDLAMPKFLPSKLHFKCIVHILIILCLRRRYIAYNIPLLAKKSATSKLTLIGHSQGAGLTPQWALDFWPSTRAYVSAYVAIAGMFHGTLGTSFIFLYCL